MDSLPDSRTINPIWLGDGQRLEQYLYAPSNIPFFSNARGSAAPAEDPKYSRIITISSWSIASELWCTPLLITGLANSDYGRATRWQSLSTASAVNGVLKWNDYCHHTVETRRGLFMYQHSRKKRSFETETVQGQECATPARLLSWYQFCYDAFFSSDPNVPVWFSIQRVNNVSQWAFLNSPLAHDECWVFFSSGAIISYVLNSPLLFCASCQRAACAKLALSTVHKVTFVWFIWFFRVAQQF